MNETVQLALIATIVPSLAAIASVFIAIKNGAKSNTIIEKVAEVQTLTDGQLSKVTKSLELANEKIAGFERLLASMVEAKGVSDRAAEKVAETAAKKLSDNAAIKGKPELS